MWEQPDGLKRLGIIVVLLQQELFQRRAGFPRPAVTELACWTGTSAASVDSKLQFLWEKFKQPHLLASNFTCERHSSGLLGWERICHKPMLAFDCHPTCGEPREALWSQLGQPYPEFGGQLWSCDGTMKIHAKQEARAHLLVVGIRNCNAFVHVEEDASLDAVQQLQARRWVKLNSRYRC